MTRTTPSSVFASAFETLAQQIRTSRTRRAQRLALVTLMEMTPHQLDDLGLDLGDIADAMAAPPPAGRVLASRRARRAVSWMSDAARAA